MNRAALFIAISLLNIGSLIITFILGFLVLFIFALSPEIDNKWEIVLGIVMLYFIFIELYKWIVTVQVVIKQNLKTQLSHK